MSDELFIIFVAAARFIVLEFVGKLRSIFDITGEANLDVITLFPNLRYERFSWIVLSSFVT